MLHRLTFPRNVCGHVAAGGGSHRQRLWAGRLGLCAYRFCIWAAACDGKFALRASFVPYRDLALSALSLGLHFPCIISQCTPENSKNESGPGRAEHSDVEGEEAHQELGLREGVCCLLSSCRGDMRHRLIARIQSRYLDDQSHHPAKGASDLRGSARDVDDEASTSPRRTKFPVFPRC